MAQERMEGTKPKSIFSGLANNAPKVEQSVQAARAVSEKVRVVHGANEGYYPLVGKTVGDVRKGLKDTFNLPGDALAEIDGKTVGDDFILGAGQNLEFSKASGTKGNDLICEVVGDGDGFNAWCDEVDRIANERGYGDKQVTVSTGRECWRDAFNDGVSPEEALDEQESYA